MTATDKKLFFEMILANMLTLTLLLLPTSVTRLGNLMDFGQLFKAFGKINLPKSPTFLGNFCKGVKISFFLVESVLGNFYRHLTTFYWSHCSHDWIERMNRKVLILDTRLLTA